MREHHPMRYNRMTEILKMVSRTKLGFYTKPLFSSEIQTLGTSIFQQKKLRLIKIFEKSATLIN